MKRCARLFPLVAVDADSFGVLVGSHQSGAELGFPRIVVGVERNEPSPDTPAQPGSDAGIEESTPHHVAGHDVVVAVEREHDVARQAPEDADEAQEKQARLKEADPEIGREVGQMLPVLVNALIGVGADVADPRDAKGAFVLQPVADQIVGQPGAQRQADRLVQPPLRDIEHQECRYDQAEDEKLLQEGRDVAARDRIVEWPVPGIEPDLSECGREDDHGDAGHEQQDSRAGLAGPKRADERAKLAIRVPARDRPRGLASHDGDSLFGARHRLAT